MEEQISSMAKEAWESNIKAQTRLIELLKSLEDAIEKNRMQQLDLLKPQYLAAPPPLVPWGKSSSAAQEEWRPQGRKGSRAFYENSSYPPDTSDSTRRKELHKHMPLLYKDRRWIKKDQDELVRNVKKQIIQYMCLENATEEGYHEAKIQDSYDIDFSAPKVKKAFNNIDWNEVANNMDGERTGAQCRTRWREFHDPMINLSEFSEDENTLIRSLVEKKLKSGSPSNPEIDWIEITKVVNNARTPGSIFQHYQRNLNTEMKNSKWSGDEDSILREAVSRFGTKNWQAVSSMLVGRTGQQCMHRWSKNLNPTIRKGKWKEEEDALLKNAIAIHGPGSWAQISKLVPGRTDVQCRERWINILDPALRRDEWTEAEDNALLEAVNLLVRSNQPIPWSTIAKHVATRTDNQCRRRFKRFEGRRKRSRDKAVLYPNRQQIPNRLQIQTPCSGDELANLSDANFIHDITRDRADEDGNPGETLAGAHDGHNVGFHEDVMPQDIDPTLQSMDNADQEPVQRGRSFGSRFWGMLTRKAPKSRLESSPRSSTKDD